MTKEENDDGNTSHRYNSGELEHRIEFAGLLPGNLWKDDLLGTQEELISEWVENPDFDHDGAGTVVLDAGIAQVRRLVPDSDRRDRQLIALGVLAAQSWLYVSALGMVEEPEEPGGSPYVPEPVTDMMAEAEYQTGRIISMLYQMGDPPDMEGFEFESDEPNGEEPECK